MTIVRFRAAMALIWRTGDGKVKCLEIRLEQAVAADNIGYSIGGDSPAEIVSFSYGRFI
jgi:hypothetical protein